MVAGPCFSFVGAGVTELTVLMALAEACTVLPTLYGGRTGRPLSAPVSSLPESARAVLATRKSSLVRPGPTTWRRGAGVGATVETRRGAPVPGAQGVGTAVADVSGVGGTILCHDWSSPSAEKLGWLPRVLSEG